MTEYEQPKDKEESSDNAVKLYAGCSLFGCLMVIIFLVSVIAVVKALI
jgi:hypothetical protein